jgi:sugar lactone lactonase YvrE
MLLSAALLAGAPRAHAADPASAKEVFESLQRDLARDKSRGDWNAFLEKAKRLSAFLNGSPTSELEVARAQLQLGHREQALAGTLRFLAMGQVHALLDGPLFQPLRAEIDEHVRSNHAAVSLAKPAFHLADPGLLPEDIDYDPSSKRFFVTSVLERRIVAIDAGGGEHPFAASPDGWPMLALKVDPLRRRLWATEVALDGFTSVPAADWGRSTLLEYDLDRGTLLSRHDGPPHGGLGDLALASNGEPIVSDGTGGGVYRLQAQELRRIDHGEFISPQTVAVCADGRRAFVPDYVRGVAALDLDSGAVRWLSTQGRYALDGIDGLYCHGGLLVAVQNGASPERVVAFTLDPAGTAVVAERVIERATPGLGTPTHGVFVGETFYYLANSGWDALDEHGVVKPSAQPTRAQVMTFGGFSTPAPAR